MDTKHIPGTIYPVGTRYSNSAIYDEATNEITFGFQVFRQCNPNGKPTGRLMFLDDNGFLCAMNMAEEKRDAAIRNAARDLLAALKRFADYPGSTCETDFIIARAAIAKAVGANHG